MEDILIQRLGDDGSLVFDDRLPGLTDKIQQKFYCRGARTTYRQGKDVYAIRRQQRTEGKPILRSQHRLIRTYNADLSR